MHYAIDKILTIVLSLQSTEAGTFGGPVVLGSPIIPRLTSNYNDVQYIFLEILSSFFCPNPTLIDQA